MTRPARRMLCSLALLVPAAAFSYAAIRAQSGAPDAASSGKAVYDRSCATCHGATGKGDGPAADVLDPAPRDFTRGVYKFRSTASSSLPTDEDLLRTVDEGLPGTSMPAFGRLLSDAQRRSVVDYIKRFSPRFAAEQPKPIADAAAADPPPPADIAAARKVYEKLACATCHGEDGAAREELRDDWGHAIRSTDLTEPWSFRGGPTARDVLARLRTGIDGSPMPSFEGTATLKELTGLADYVVSLARKPVWKMNAAEIKARYDLESKQAASKPVERGRYLVTVLNCSHCHSPIGADGRGLPGMLFAGGVKFDIAPYGEFVSYNLTSDKDTGLGNWSDGEIKAVLTRGTRPDGTRLLPFPMGWPSYARLTEGDLKAVVAFLRTIPPVANRIPPPKAPNVFAFLAGKFRWLILKEVPAMTISYGNAGSAGSGKAAGNQGY